MIKQLHLLAISIGLLSLLPVAPLLADEVEVDEIDNIDTVKCIRIRSLRSTKIVDDLNIIFSMIGSKTYHNILPRQCHGLARQDRFSYQTTTGSLCNLDTIRILYQAGSSLQEGNACRLGLFHPISKEDAAALLDKPNQPLEAEPIPLPEPEEIGIDSDESGNEQQT
jgi:hypothetical protein